MWGYARLLVLGSRVHALACGSDAYPIGCAWGLRICGGFPIDTRSYHSCEGTVVLAVSPRGRRHKRRRLRRGCGAHRPNAAGLDCARDRRCGSNGRFVVAAMVLSLNGVCICAHPHALPPHACGGGCRRVPYSLAICSPFSRFIRRIRFIICASACTWRLRVHPTSCSRAL